MELGSSVQQNNLLEEISNLSGIKRNQALAVYFGFKHSSLRSGKAPRMADKKQEWMGLFRSETMGGLRKISRTLPINASLIMLNAADIYAERSTVGPADVAYELYHEVVSTLKERRELTEDQSIDVSELLINSVLVSTGKSYHNTPLVTKTTNGTPDPAALRNALFELARSSGNLLSLDFLRSFVEKSYRVSNDIQSSSGQMQLPGISRPLAADAVKHILVPEVDAGKDIDLSHIYNFMEPERWTM